MRTSQTAYRGYGIDVFGKGKRWHFSARPIGLNLPMLMHNAFALDAKSEDLALVDAKLQIDSLLAYGQRSKTSASDCEQDTPMTAFQVRCYINGVPDADVLRVDAATALDAAEMIYGGPLTAIHRQVHCRALVHSNRHKRTFFYAPA
jgi:hypothetical protein